MAYAVDLAKIPLGGYLALLKGRTLLPSRRMLLVGADVAFAKIEAQGITTVARLLNALSTPSKIEALAKQSGVAAAYLAVLRREAGTLAPKPVPLAAFPGTDKAEIEALAIRGIKTSKQLWEGGEPVGRLYALCDLARVNGVGPSAAAMFYAAGCRSAADIAGADAAELLLRVGRANRGGRYYAGTLGEKDMRFCIGAAELLLRFSD